ncbi:MAG: allophanate hydrolase [Bdellovibrio bacteriovorus]
MTVEALNLSISYLRERYLIGKLQPAELVAAIRSRIVEPVPGPVWIHVLSDGELAPYLDRLVASDPKDLPLYGIPFAIKDNIDLEGVPTTAACPAFAYTAGRSAHVVERLISAGAIPIGKTNLDQFATGLVGTRSPFGQTPNAFDPAFISGGSSSGSAVAVAQGLVSFALGTDTAGSGRVPAAFNNLIGIKPTRGLISTTGVVPACRTLDCVSVFALDLADAEAVMAVAAHFDPKDPYARAAADTGPELGDGGGDRPFRFGVPDSLQFFGATENEGLFAAAVARLRELGGEPVSLDFGPFAEAARLLYEGPWVAERYAAIEPFIERQPEALLEVTRGIIAPAAEARAVDAFKAQYRLAALKRRADAAMQGLDCVLTPTAPTCYRIAEVESDPIALNSRLGTYTNFMNLLDLAAVAVPAGFRTDGLPFGVTLFGPAFSDVALARLADRFHRAQDLPLGATGRSIASIRRSGAPAATAAAPTLGAPRLNLVVCGAHLSGLPLNHQLTERGAVLVQATRTAPRYRLYALPGGPPERPGLIRQPEVGAEIEVEVWSLPVDQVGGFLAGIPAPLGLGSVELADGTWEKGFICEGFAVQGALDITRLGGWRAYANQPGC